MPYKSTLFYKRSVRLFRPSSLNASAQLIIPACLSLNVCLLVFVVNIDQFLYCVSSSSYGSKPRRKFACVLEDIMFVFKKFSMSTWGVALRGFLWRWNPEWHGHMTSNETTDHHHETIPVPFRNKFNIYVTFTTFCVMEHKHNEFLGTRIAL